MHLNVNDVYNLADTFREVEIIHSVSIVEDSIGAESSLCKSLPDLTSILTSSQS